MTKHKKQPLAFLSAFAMVLTLLMYFPSDSFSVGMTISAEEELTCSHKDLTKWSWGHYYYHSIDEKYVYVHGYLGRDTILEVPNLLGGKPVYGVESESFSTWTNVTDIYLPDTVGDIEDGAFNENQTVWLKFPQNLSNMTCSYTGDYIERNNEFTATFTADEGYTLPSNITILRYTTPLVQDKDYTYNSSTGELTIFADCVDIPLSISASADKKIEPATISFADYYATTDPLNPVIIAKAEIDTDGTVIIPDSVIETDENYIYGYYWQYVEQNGNVVDSELVDINYSDEENDEGEFITVKSFVKTDAIAGMEYFVYIVKKGRSITVQYNLDGKVVNSSLEMSPIHFTYGDDVSFGKVPQKEGYDFDGWYFESDYSGNKFTEQSLADYKGKYDQNYILKVYGRYVEHAHNLKAVPAKSATCTSNGNTAYYECSVCGMLFEDANGTTEITLDEVTIPAAHKLSHVDANDPTCTKIGNTEHYKCDVCGMLFTDENGEKETTLEAVTIPAAHKLSHVDANDATCTEDGNTEHYKCDVCEKLFEDENGAKETTLEAVTIPAAHKLTPVSAKAATCTTDGNSEYWYCDTCGKYFSDAAGTTELSDIPVIQKKGHNWSSAWETDENYHWHKCLNAGCTIKSGKARHYSNAAATEDSPEVCRDCGYEMNPALGHTHNLATKYSSDETGHWYACSDCDEKVDFEKHTEDSGTVTADGKVFRCIKCGWVIRTEAVQEIEKPVITKCFAGVNMVGLNWTSVEGAESYRVYYWADGKWTYAGSRTVNGMYVRNLTAGKKYGFAVKAVAGGKVSEVVSADIRYATPMAALTETVKPAITKAFAAGNGTVGLNWTSVEGAESYRVYYWADGKWTYAGSRTVNGMYVRNLTAGKSYGFAVKAYVNGKYTDVVSKDIVYVTVK